MKLEKLANYQSELTFLVKWSPDNKTWYGLINREPVVPSGHI